MPRRNQAGACCCGGCGADRSYDATADWQAQVGGTVENSSEVSGSLNIDGPVSPASTPSHEAYLIEFTIEYGGSVDFDFGGIACSVDTVTKVVDAGGNTDEYARPNRDAGRAQVQIRVTPSHILVAAKARYQDPIIFNQDTMAIVTVDRTGAVPSFTADWDDATISNFTIKDSKSDPANELYCFTPTLFDCPYSYLKSATNNHAHDGQSTLDLVGEFGSSDRFVTGDVALALVTPITSGSFPAEPNQVGSAFFSDVASQSSNSSPVDVHFRNSNEPCFPTGLLVRLLQWIDNGEGVGAPYIVVSRYESSDVTNGGQGSVGLVHLFSTVYPTPTVAVPYPKPNYNLAATIRNRASITCFDTRFPGSSVVADHQDWEAEASIDLDIPVNTLSAGITASATPTGSWSWRSGSPPDPADAPFYTCGGSLPTDDRIEVGMSWNI